jgi:hypothetical protein
VTTLTPTIKLEAFGERHQATVHMGDDLISAVVRDNPRSAVIAALEDAAHDIAHELVYRPARAGSVAAALPWSATLVEGEAAVALNEWRRPDGTVLLKVRGDGCTPFADPDYQPVGIVEHWRNGELVSSRDYPPQPIDPVMLAETVRDLRRGMVTAKESDPTAGPASMGGPSRVEGDPR